MNTYIKRVTTILLLSVFCISSKAQAPRLSNQAHISLITCSPGEALYEAFGHSALRVVDPLRGLDRTYNYGTFNFDQPHFYANFAKGNLQYYLSVNRTKYFIAYYIHYNRSVYEDILNLTQDEKQRLFDFLEVNYLPENRIYQYDYFYDNCSTRIRDALEEILNRRIVWDTSYIKTNYTIRELVDLYAKDAQPWGDLAIDLALGLPMDKVASPYEYMFLPDYLRSGFLHASIQKQDTIIPLVKKSVVINKADPEVAIGTMFFTPFQVFGLIFFLGLFKTARDIRKEKFTVWFDVPLFFLVGLLGSILAFISFATDHAAAADNFNLLWAIPFHLPVALLLHFRKKIPVLRFYFIGTMVILLILVVGSFTFIPQKIHYALAPLILLLGMRSFMLARGLKPL